jgi:hypothetical protein
MYDRHAHAVGGRSHEPAPIFPSRPCSPTGKPANDLQGKACSHATAGSIARIATRRRLVCSVAAIAPFMCDGATSALLKSSERTNFHAF